MKNNVYRIRRSKGCQNVYFDYLRNHISRLFKLVKKENISLIFPSSIVRGELWSLIACLNQAFHLSGVNCSMAQLWRYKTAYLKYFKQLGFKTPQLYQTLSPGEEPDLSSIPSFPVICKPDSGSGSSGVFLVKSPDMLLWFFQPDPCQNLSKFEKYWRVRFKNKKYANYVYQDCGSNYIVEEFIQGPLLSVVGIKAVNGIEISVIFKIGPSAPPFRSEHEFLIPYPDDQKAVEKAQSLVYRLVKESVFPYGPFMLDFIISSKGEFYLIDAAPRMSATASAFFKPCYNDIYYDRRAIMAFLGRPIDIQKRSKPLNHLCLRRLPLPRGRFIRFSQKEPFSDYVVSWKFTLRPGDIIYPEHMDSLQVKRGELVVRGANMKEAGSRWLREFQKLKFSIEENKSSLF